MLHDKKKFRRAYILLCIVGTCVSSAMPFVAAGTVLPPLIKSLGGPTWLITLMPVMMMLGVGWPPILTAHVIERQEHYKPMMLVTTFLQRIPYLLTGAVLLCFSENRILALTAIAMSPFLFGLIGGLSSTAWYGWIAKILPPNKRSSAFAIQAIISSLIGISAGGVIAYVLKTMPGAPGYGVLHIITFAVLMISYAALVMLHEPKATVSPEKHHVTLLDNVRAIPGIVRNDKRFVRYVLSRSFASGVFIMIPFLSIHALETTGRPEEYLGYFVAAQMVGAIVGNVIAGYVGDRYGTRDVLLGSLVIYVIMCVVIPLASHEWLFLIVFGLYGIAQCANRVANMTLGLELAPKGRLPTYMALASAVSAPSMLAASAVSAIVWKMTHNYLCLCVIAGACLVAAILFMCKVREPRSHDTFGEDGESVDCRA